MEYYSSIKRTNDATCSDMDGLRDSHTVWSKSGREIQILHAITYKWQSKKKVTNELIYKTEIEL